MPPDHPQLFAGGVLPRGLPTTDRYVENPTRRYRGSKREAAFQVGSSGLGEWRRFEMNEQEKVERARRLKLRLAMLQRHNAARGPDGKSALAVEAGRRAGAIAVEKAGSGEILGLMLALKRWHPDEAGMTDYSAIRRTNQ